MFLSDSSVSRQVVDIAVFGLEIRQRYLPIVQSIQLFFREILIESQISLSQPLQVLLAKFHHFIKSHWFQLIFKIGDPWFEHGLDYDGTADQRVDLSHELLECQDELLLCLAILVAKPLLSASAPMHIMLVYANVDQVVHIVRQQLSAAAWVTLRKHVVIIHGLSQIKLTVILTWSPPLFSVHAFNSMATINDRLYVMTGGSCLSMFDGSWAWDLASSINLSVLFYNSWSINCVQMVLARSWNLFIRPTHIFCMNRQRWKVG